MAKNTKISYRDIPQYIGLESRGLTLHLSNFKKTIEKFIKEDGLNLSPDFQRDYVWTKNQKSRYIEHLLKGGRTGTTLIFNYPGWYKGESGGMEVIDGKQRISAILDFLNNEIPAFSHLCCDFEKQIPLRYYLEYMIVDFESRVDVLKLYLQLNEAGTPHTEAELAKVRELLADEEAKNSCN
jgi:uncharacterized protein with ParB-like and HNH nuclease domain